MAYNGHAAYFSGGSSSSSSSSSTTGSGSKRVRTITLVRRPGVRLGFSLRGGKEHGTGFFVTAVEPNTEANHQGLLVGDQILRVNGFPVEDATHKEVLQLILGQNSVSLKVKSVGMIPVKETAEDELSWQIVDTKPAITLPSNNGIHHPHNQIDTFKPDPNDDPPGLTNRQLMADVKMILKVPPRAKLGCGICKGPEWKPGVFVQFTKENSIARTAGLRPGDQILQCNNFPFTPETPFNEAVSVMRCCGVLELKVRKGAGLDLFPGESSGYNSSASSVAGDNPPRVSNINEDNITNQQSINDPLQCNGHRTLQSDRVNNDHPNNDAGRNRGYPNGSTVIHVGGDDTDNHKIAEIRMVSQQLETKTTTVFVEVHHSEEDNVSRTQSEASTDRLTNSSSVSSFTSSASSLSSAISQELERRSKRTAVDPTNPGCTQTDKLIKSGLAKEKVQQHEQLMMEFKKAHKKMFSNDCEEKGPNQAPTIEEREELRLQNDNPQQGCKESYEQCNKVDKVNKTIADQQERVKPKKNPAPPPPPPLPTGSGVKEYKPIQKISPIMQSSATKKHAAPAPPPSPPYCPTPDYDTASLASQMTTDDNNKEVGESDTVKRKTTENSANRGKILHQKQKSDIVEMQSLESFKLTNPSTVKPKPPNTYFSQNCSSNQSDTSNGTASTLPIKDYNSKPVVTIREYPGGKERKNPTKFDFLQNGSSCQPIVDDNQPIASRLQNELSQTLQRATTLSNQNEMQNPTPNGQVTKNGGNTVTINISSQQNNIKTDAVKQPFYLFPNGKINGIENRKINDLMQQSSSTNNLAYNNKMCNGKTRSIDCATKNSVTFNFNNKSHETRTSNAVQPNGILKNGSGISHVHIQSQIPQHKSIKFGGM